MTAQEIKDLLCLIAAVSVSLAIVIFVVFCVIMGFLLRKEMNPEEEFIQTQNTYNDTDTI